MKILSSCMVCATEAMAAGQGHALPSGLSFVLPTDDGIYKVTCSKGHATTTILQAEKFELLFEIALFAIIDGYYREAVTTFASALERYYEFAINVYCSSRGLSRESRARAWSDVAKQSERQLGAFVYLHVACTGTDAPVLRGKHKEFRNEVVHKGKIPTLAETMEFGTAVKEILESGVALMRTQFLEDSQALGRERMHDLHRRCHGQNVAVMSQAFAISLLSEEKTVRSLGELVEELRRNRGFMELALGPARTDHSAVAWVE